MELNEKETHCMARLLQGMIYNGGLFGGCPFCKYQCFKDEGSNRHIYFYRVVQKKLADAAGVDLKPYTKSAVGLQNFLQRFLQNSNDEIKEILRPFFEEHIAED